MDTALLKKHISVYKQNLAKDPEKHIKDLTERKERIAYYQSLSSWSMNRSTASVWFHKDSEACPVKFA